MTGGSEGGLRRHMWYTHIARAQYRAIGNGYNARSSLAIVSVRVNISLFRPKRYLDEGVSSLKVALLHASSKITSRLMMVSRTSNLILSAFRYEKKASRPSRILFQSHTSETVSCNDHSLSGKHLSPVSVNSTG